MDHAKKLLLVPQERLTHFVYDHLSDLDNQMHDILKKRGLAESEKAMLYQQILQKYVKYPFPRQGNWPSENRESESSDPLSFSKQDEPSLEVKREESVQPEFDLHKLSDTSKRSKSDDVEREIIRSVPVKFKAAAENLISFMSKSSVFWTPDKELVVNGKVSRNTNIVDLINHLIRDRKVKPPGHKILYEALVKNSIPSVYVKNKYLKKKTMFAKPIVWDAY